MSETLFTDRGLTALLSERKLLYWHYEDNFDYLIFDAAVLKIKRKNDRILYPTTLSILNENVPYSKRNTTKKLFVKPEKPRNIYTKNRKLMEESLYGNSLRRGRNDVRGPAFISYSMEPFVVDFNLMNTLDNRNVIIVSERNRNIVITDVSRIGVEMLFVSETPLPKR